MSKTTFQASGSYTKDVGDIPVYDLWFCEVEVENAELSIYLFYLRKCIRPTLLTLNDSGWLTKIIIH